MREAYDRLQHFYTEHPRWVVAFLIAGFIVGATMFLLVSEQAGVVVELITAALLLPFLPPGPSGGDGPPELPRVDRPVNPDISSGPYL